jgi:phospholipase C
METPQWSSTVIFLTWSNYGGYYDHVPPPFVDSLGLGVRVPLLIISPYAKAGFMEHDQTEFASLLKSVEVQYGLPSLSTRDLIANDVWDAFDFSQQPLPPLILTPQSCLTLR